MSTKTAPPAVTSKPEQVKEKAEFQLKPYHVLIFVWSIFAGILGIMAVFPQDGIEVTENFTLYFPTISEFFAEDTTEAPDLDQILADLEQPDTSKAVDRKDSLMKASKRIQYPNGDKSVLYPVFRSLEQLSREKRSGRILHYGDSQIEGDRMTALIRARLQERFGGSGPGLFAAKPLVTFFSIKQDYSESMHRYTMYGFRDSTVNHRRYGAMAIFSRFSPIVPDSALNGEEHTGWVSIEKSSSAYNKSKSFNTLRMFFGHHRRTFHTRLFVDDVPFAQDSFPPRNRLEVARWYFEKTPKKIMMIMSGEDSPNIYGMSLENNTGLVVDNISMRGSSGTLFGGIDYGSFKPMIDSLNVKLYLLQYGGNVVPYIKNKKSAERFGKDFKRQIEYLKKQAPDAGVIVIGPSDMSTKVKGKMQTYPQLEDVRDALKQAAFETGSAYFDIYEVMGGKNSMIEWVEGDRNLAARDYVHFQPAGAKLIAEKFLSSFLEDYEEYRNSSVQ